MEKNKIRNLNIKTKLKALLLSGVTLLTGISCGKSDVKAPEKDNSIAIEAETNTKTTKNTIESTVDNMIAEKETQENNTNDYVENYNYENEENNYVEDETNIETTETKTEEKTENKIEAPSKVYEEEIVMPKKGASMTPSTNHTTTKIKNSDIKITTTRAHTQHPTTTKKVTTQRHTTVKITTTKPVTTTVRVTEPPVVTEPPRTDYNKYDLLSGDPAVAAKALEKLSEELWQELYDGRGINRGYLSNGRAESKVAIAILNYGSISPETLARDEALGNYSEEDLITYSHALDFEVVEQIVGTRVDFTKYMLDEDFANLINRTNAAWIDCENGDKEEYLNITNDYYENYYGDNLIKDYYMTLAGASREGASAQKMETLYNLMDEYDNNIVKPMYNNYAQYIGNSYRK